MTTFTLPSSPMLKTYRELSIAVFLCMSVKDIDNYHIRIGEDFLKYSNEDGFQQKFESLLSKAKEQHRYILKDFKTN